jgi:hypothetical protein
MRSLKSIIVIAFLCSNISFSQDSVSYYNWMVDSIQVKKEFEVGSSSETEVFHIRSNKLIIHQNTYYINLRKKACFTSENFTNAIISQHSTELTYNGAQWFVHLALFIDEDGNLEDVWFSGSPESRGLSYDMELKALIMKTSGMWKPARKWFKESSSVLYLKMTWDGKVQRL